MKLTVELVPETLWFKNLRSELSRKEWDRLRKESYKKANYKCEICGGVGPKWPVECHEIWDYNDTTNVQTLKGLISLCANCHQCKHMGLAEMQGHYEKAKTHLAKINEIDIDEANDYLTECFAIWKKRSLKEWTTDLSWLERN